MINLRMTDNREDIRKWTGLPADDYDQALWEAGFNLDDWDVCFESDKRLFKRVSDGRGAHPNHQVKGELISREDAIDLVENVETARLKGEIDLVYASLIKGLKELPSEPVGNSDRLRPKGKWIVNRYDSRGVCWMCVR